MKIKPTLKEKFISRQMDITYKGYSLLEMLVVLVIVSILAVTAKPFVEMNVKRSKEANLREALRMIRNALDEFHDDCTQQKIISEDTYASRYCYPVYLKYLVDGVNVESVEGAMLKRYLRKIPSNPFSTDIKNLDEHWIVRGYLDDPKSRFWDGDDVFDVKVNYEGIALDGTNYEDW